MPHLSPEVEEIIAQVEAWGRERVPLASKGRPGGKAGVDSLREFVETMNYRTRKVISLLDMKSDPEFWSALKEIATQAETLVSKRKVIADGIDRTNL